MQILLEIGRGRTIKTHEVIENNYSYIYTVSVVLYNNPFNLTIKREGEASVNSLNSSINISLLTFFFSESQDFKNQHMTKKIRNIEICIYF